MSKNYGTKYTSPAVTELQRIFNNNVHIIKGIYTDTSDYGIPFGEIQKIAPFEPEKHGLANDSAGYIMGRFHQQAVMQEVRKMLGGNVR